MLANEQVVGGRCERCDTLVTKKKLTQWYLRITDYADRLLDDMDQLEGDWPEQVLTMQRNWIGRSSGADVQFVIEGREEPVTVFTTRPGHPVRRDVLRRRGRLRPGRRAGRGDTGASRSSRRTWSRCKRRTEIERLATDRPKTGVFLDRYAINPVNGERLPVYAADYVLADYGTGAIMAVPAHDQRDLDFARAFGLPVRVVVDTGGEDPAVTGVATPGDGVLVNSGRSTGWPRPTRSRAVTEDSRRAGRGEAATNYRLRDWLISRQRYWGTPIPIVHCPTCGEVPVPDDQLPVRLPDAAGLDLAPKGTSPLGAIDRLGQRAMSAVRRPGEARHRHDGHVRRLVVVLPAVLLAGSRRRRVRPRGRRSVDAGRPVHRRRHARDPAPAVRALLHQGAATTSGMVGFTEPFTRLLNQGMVGMDGAAMSKSRGNLVRLSDELDEHGVDAVRLTMVFAGPPEDDIDWADVSAAGSAKFLARAWRLPAMSSAPRGVVARRRGTWRCAG